MCLASNRQSSIPSMDSTPDRGNAVYYSAFPLACAILSSFMLLLMMSVMTFTGCFQQIGSLNIVQQIGSFNIVSTIQSARSLRSSIFLSDFFISLALEHQMVCRVKLPGAANMSSGLLALLSGGPFPVGIRPKAAVSK